MFKSDNEDKMILDYTKVFFPFLSIHQVSTADVRKMPLFGKIVVIKRNGTDGNEFPLTASCLFGRSVKHSHFYLMSTYH